MQRKQRLALVLLVALAGFALATLQTFAIEQPELAGAKVLVFRQDEVAVSELNMPVSSIADATERARAGRLSATESRSHFDLRTGRFATLMPSVSLLPGRGQGNSLTWQQMGVAEPKTTVELQTQAWQAFKQWLSGNSAALRIDPNELADPGRVTVLSPDYLQIYSPRRVDGLPVRGAHVTATIKYGNLVIFGAYQWGDVDTTRSARLTKEQAIEALAAHAAPFRVGNLWKTSELMWVPVTSANIPTAAEFGNGLEHRLAWVIRPTFDEEHGQYEALVDAVDGRVLSIEDYKQHVATARSVEGGTYTVSNDGLNPDGIEQPDYPMPFANVTTPAGTVTTDFGGNLPACVDGSISHNLTGQYMTMVDNCGAANLSGTGNLDWGVSGGTDCTTPGTGGVGNTHASRTGFYELNMIKAMARGQLPNNAWLQDNLVSNMNINSTCNAFWNGASVNFYRSGGGCNNTGELAGVFDHEWGHGMDNNDGVPSISLPGEGIADIYGSLRLDDSCLGRNFRATNCGGYGNPCTACTGVRDIDWAKHTANTPFTMTQADACGTGGPAPCGGSVHCEGQVYSQAVWDLWNRDLVGAPSNLSLDIARELATQLTYRGASGVQSWYSCTNGTGGCGNPAGCGCAATSGYQQYLVADDDNGNLADGTPHMGAIFAAFNRHGIACGTPTVTTAGCSGTPTAVPVVTASARDRGVALSWTTSAGATGYRIYRTDGVFQCSFGKELIATVTGTEYFDFGLKNGHNYYYQVVPMGPADECFSVASSCTTGTPAGGANIAFVVDNATATGLSGDSDSFIDNCESTQVTVPVSNIGTGTQTNVRLVSVVSTSHPSSVIQTSFPAPVTASLAACAEANATFSFIGDNLEFGETLTFLVEVTSDELGGETRIGEVSFTNLEADFQNFATKTFNFDTTTEEWTTVQGTFARDNAGGGANATPFYMESSSFLDNQCDVVRSPPVRLTATSTMELFNQYNIEPFDGTQWWDRANISVLPLGGSRTVVSPSGGRAYEASGTGGVCGLDFQPGWAGANATWGSATWNASALQSVTFAGQVVQLEVRYGTDPAANNFGFRFDQLTLTNFDLGVADAQTNVCAAVPIFADGFESGSTSAWTSDFP